MFATLWGKRVRGDVVHHRALICFNGISSHWRLAAHEVFLQCPVDYFSLLLESSLGKRNGYLPPLRRQGEAEHIASRLQSSVRCGAVHCYLAGEATVGHGRHFCHSNCIFCQRGYFSAMEEFRISLYLGLSEQRGNQCLSLLLHLACLSHSAFTKNCLTESRAD